MKFADIPKFTSDGNYSIDIPLDYVEHMLNHFNEGYGLKLNPDFQRGNVWTREQQIAWLEFFLRGGKTSRIIYFNCAEFSQCYAKNRNMRNIKGMYCVDGLQRLTAILGFLHDEIPAFGHYYSEFEDGVPYEYCLVFNVNSLQTRKEMLQWYIDMNSGGTIHPTEEIERVRQLMDSEEEQ